MRLHIETTIRTDLDRLWAHTQDPARHQRWDLRFHRIEYLHRNPGEPQLFRYASFGISGTGLSTGQRHLPDGGATSALRFACAHPLSLIREGSGYWRYRPGPDGVEFVTGYDYRPGWGALGPVADLAFRPLMRWGTAWSFDRLRLWLERGRSPEASLRAALADAGARLLAVLASALLPGPPVWPLVAALVLVLPPTPLTPAARRCRYAPRMEKP
ncbi:hypothetical protein JOF53_003134 [Crossiella equi]|uniref:Polyketide cyclase / dehydrase and lipid transport n=1 Tax=Crossiella equi TaxID=130796 RepID=A0ABS5ACE7_9PSEU|nr:hypothetical protein [Crossiella equi]MBP2474262.1 hypothetical protein [Crossiella equi]